MPVFHRLFHTKMNNGITIGITCGDINGIGLETVLKALLLKKAGQQFCLIIYGSTKVVAYHKNIITTENIQFFSVNTPEEAQPGRINIINCWTDNVNITLGKPTEVSGKCAYLALERAVSDLKAGSLDALVTAPIHKKAMQMAGFPFVGHTEYLTQALGGEESVMLLVSDELRVGLVSGHLPLREVPNAITLQKVFKKTLILSETLRVDFGINKPTVAVLGLNPHAGDEGAIGSEEQTILQPAIEQAREHGVLAYGPFPADSFFGSGLFRKFDAVLAMYHDQGLGPFKTLSFGEGINYTAGLSAVRTSPDHGTAYDIAGKGEADETSFIRALYLAADIARNRNDYLEMRANSLEISKRKALVNETGEDEEVLDVPEE